MTQDSQRTVVVAVFDSRARAEEALVALNLEGVDMTRLSIVGQDFDVKELTSEPLEPDQFFVLVHGTVEVTVHARAVLGAMNSPQQETPISAYE